MENTKQPIVLTSKFPLDPDQEKCVHAEDQNVLVVAGAGSGKTRVLTERIKYLLDTGVDAVNIVAITFTNMAADEMKARLRDVSALGDAFVGTIHSFANRIYKNSGNPYSLMTDEAEHLIVEEILLKPANHGLTLKRWLAFKDQEKKADMGQIDESVLSNFFTATERNVYYKLFDQMEVIRKRDNIITFDELIEYATEYYESLGASIEHILVDEFQDIGTLEYKFIRALNAEHYFFVGDDYQAIYGFKGGNVSIFKGLCNRKKDNFTTYFLNRNYRSTKEVIKLSEDIIQQVPDRIHKKAVVTHTGTGTVRIMNKGQIDQGIRMLLADKANWKDWFVLTRTNKEAYQLADMLDDYLIDYCFIRRSDLTLEELQEAMQKNLVKVMTVHSAKGLENKKVLLFGRFPLKIPPYFKDTDERKVMYVGITRAIEELYIFN